MKRKKLVLITSAVAVALIAVVVVMLRVVGSDDYQYKRNMDLANRYLEELDYEQAIATYLAAIEIDPKSVDAYLGAAEAYLGLGNWEEAIAILVEGYEKTEDEAIQSRIEELRAEYSSGSVAVDGEINFVMPFSPLDYSMGDITLLTTKDELLALTNATTYGPGSRGNDVEWQGSYMGYDLYMAQGSGYSSGRDSDSIFLVLDSTGSTGLSVFDIDPLDDHAWTSIFDRIDDRNYLLSGPILAGDSLDKLLDLIPFEEIFGSELPAEDSFYGYNDADGMYVSLSWWPQGNSSASDMPVLNISYRTLIEEENFTRNITHYEIEFTLDLDNQTVSEVWVYHNKYD